MTTTGFPADPAPPPKRVLVIEDNHHLAQLFGDLLKMLGCTTSVVLNARAGLAAANRSRPDLVFCDLRLPGEFDGFDFAREFRSIPHLSAVPLIAVTGLQTDANRRQALDAGFDRVFVKPLKF